ncbi:hypothetical protein GYMLUDRAFT_73942 [Collybiopsis luxurians FD-317 M1]|uniref:RING-type domain-containing protein n=1 Tax=Collybiopsis luxurians FD-317 M1 TaxID=944289 RepID=A0A0D0CDF9_9AGAR|nr:hypothetical protein GYMLUDRAFT_73942 [Collybiopsis luxurians FD-317 M1]
MDYARRSTSLSGQNPNRRPRPVNTIRRGSEESLSGNINVASRRSKSRSPSRSAARNDPFSALNASMTMAKISTGTRSLKSTSSSSARQSASSHDPDMFPDAGQRVSTAAVSIQKTSSSRPTTPAAGASNIQKKDKGKDRQSKSHGPAEATFSGPLAVAEFERMRKEIDTLKNTLIEQKKTAKKQAKKIEDLKVEVANGKEARDSQEAQLQNLRTKHSRNEELLNTIETSLTCNICMDLLNKPFSLSPCGHTFCLRDLQDWFRKAPPTDDDMDVDADDPDYIKYREKSCPACRAVVVGRPLPVFFVKDVISALQKAKTSGDAQTSSTCRSTSPYVSEDPWEGLFPDEDELDPEGQDEEDEGLEFGILYSDSDSEMDVQDDVTEYDSNGEPIEQDEDNSVGDDGEEAASDEDEEGYSDEDDEASYVPQQWEPPFYGESDLPVETSEAQLTLLRRGCSPWLTSRYRMKYTHSRGLVAHLNSLDPDDVGTPLRGNINNMHHLFLGWNIRDSDFSEYGSRVFLRRTLEDFKLWPHRFSVHERRNGYSDIHVLVNASILGLEYNTTDSEMWV